jgi:hypothetical protein
VLRIGLSIPIREAREAAESRSRPASDRQRLPCVFCCSAFLKCFTNFICLFELPLLDPKSRSRSSNKRSLNPFGSRKACTDNSRLGLAEHMVENFHNYLTEKRYLPTYHVVRISIYSAHYTGYSRFCE